MTFFQKVSVFLGVAGMIAVILSFIIGVSALGGFICEELWNFIVTHMHHTELRVDFLVAWAAMFLLSLVTSSFKTSQTVTHKWHHAKISKEKE